MNIVKIGEFIKEQRTALGLTQKQLAEKLGCTDKAVSRWETGKGLPDMSFIIPLSKELSVSVNELLNGEKIIPVAATDEEAEKMAKFMEKSERVVVEVIRESDKKEKEKTKTVLFLTALFVFQTISVFVVPSFLPVTTEPIAVIIALTALFSCLAGTTGEKLKFFYPAALEAEFVVVWLLDFLAEKGNAFTSDRLPFLLVGSCLAAFSLACVALCSLVRRAFEMKRK